MLHKMPIPLVFLIGVVTIGDVILVRLNVIEVSDAINLILVAGLVGATLGLWESTDRYTKETNEIAKATFKQVEATTQQAEATKNLAEEAEKQREDSLKPAVVLRTPRYIYEKTPG